MSIKYFEENKQFVLTTKDTAYVFDIFHGRYLRHLYFGEKTEKSFDAKNYSWVLSPYRCDEYGKVAPHVMMHEYSFFGAGDFRPSALRICGKDGTGVTDFEYRSYRIFKGRRGLDGLPSARADERTQTLEITMYDTVNDCRLLLYYTVFPDENIISRYIALENNGDHRLKIEKCMSMTLDIDSTDLDIISLWGSDNNEMNYQRHPLYHGTQSFTSRTGSSSHRYNPFFALCSHGANEDKGEVYGFNFVYSGSFLNEIEFDDQKRIRVNVGLGNENFSYVLDAGDRFISPEAIMTYSSEGIGKMTRNMHSFIRGHILPEVSVNRPHPVVLNTWEACYFNIDEEKLFSFAEEAKKTGIDMLVVDDGWFGARNNDSAGLGDWSENKEKFPNGLKSFVDRIKSTGLKFGIWVEPEMVNPDSDLYRAHPDWCLRTPEREPLLSRKQLVLDMSNPEVVNNLIAQFEKTFGDLDIDYFKWDMNRYLCDVGSSTLPSERQGEVRFRYMKGVYRLLELFAEKFPNAIIETCSGGGGRYDLGMMCYGFQIWASDNTDPYARTRIQYGALTAYPSTTMSCHVSDPKNSIESLDYRYKVAVGGMLGYELYVLKMSDEIKKNIAKQIHEYKQFEHIVRLGEYYRLVSPIKNEYSAYYYILPDKSELLLSIIESAVCEKAQTKKLKLSAVTPHSEYVEVYTGRHYTGKELREGSCFEIKGTRDSAQLLWLKRLY